MDFLVIGTIKSIVPNKFGIFVNVRETKIGGITKNGREVGTHDYMWGCLAQSEAIQRYVQNYFKIGAVAKIKGTVEQMSTHDEKSPNFKAPVYKIESIDLWNMGDPLKKKNRERYNARAIGDGSPDVEHNNFEDDF